MKKDLVRLELKAPSATRKWLAEMGNGCMQDGFDRVTNRIQDLMELENEVKKLLEEIKKDMDEGGNPGVLGLKFYARFSDKLRKAS